MGLSTFGPSQFDVSKDGCCLTTRIGRVVRLHPHFKFLNKKWHKDRAPFITASYVHYVSNNGLMAKLLSNLLIKSMILSSWKSCWCQARRVLTIVMLFYCGAKVKNVLHHSIRHVGDNVTVTDTVVAWSLHRRHRRWLHRTSTFHRAYTIEGYSCYYFSDVQNLLVKTLEIDVTFSLLGTNFLIVRPF